MTEFEEELWYTTVDCIKVFADGRLRVVFRDGGEVDIAVNNPPKK